MAILGLSSTTSFDNSRSIINFMAGRRTLTVITEAEEQSLMAAAKSELRVAAADIKSKAREFEALLQNEVYLLASLIGKILAKHRREGQDVVQLTATEVVIDQVDRNNQATVTKIKMMALINAKRLLNIFGGRHQPIMASIQGFENVKIGHEPLDLLNVINLGLSNPLLAKLQASESLVSSFTEDVVKEFEAVLRPQVTTGPAAEVQGVTPGQDQANAREPGQSATRGAGGGGEAAEGTSKGKEQAVR